MKVTFKYFVIPVFVLSYLVFCAHADISLRALNIDIFIHKDGSATIREEYILNVVTNESMDIYNRNIQYLQKNDLQTWINNLKFDELRYHIGGKEAPISDLIITPSKLYGINYYTEEGLAKIILDYKANAPITIDNESRGLFTITKPKPRVTRYVLNRDGLNLDMTEDGDVILPKNTVMTIHLDEDMYVLYVQPFPSNVNITRFSEIKTRDLRWTTGILPKFSLIVESEESLESEILSYLNEKNEALYNLFLGPEGAAVVIIIFIILFSVLYWHRIRVGESNEV